MAWEVGMRWGDHHPDPEHPDWYGADSIWLENDELHLTVRHLPRYFDDIKKMRNFCSGCVSGIDHVHRGYYKFEYTLPVGRNLWPAIWMYSAKRWPPEIDITEGWTSSGLLCKHRRDYRRMFKNNIHPTVHYTVAGEYKQLAFHDGLLKGTSINKQSLSPRCTCELFWEKDSIEFRYNGQHVGLLTDEVILKALDEPMTIILDLALQSNFSMDDLQDYQANGREFVIHDIIYEP